MRETARPCSCLHGEITPFVVAYAKDSRMAARVLYWSGFALWRRAINGFNDNVDAAEQQADLKQAQVEFEESAKRDPAFVDAKVGASHAWSLIGLLTHRDRVHRIR